MNYPPKIYNIDNFHLAIAIAEEIKFANIAFIKDHEIEIISAPVIINNANNITTLEGHLWKKNPIYNLLNTSNENLVKCNIIFNVADRYISPNVYEEKATSGQVVPTWDYLTAQFSGTMQKVDEQELITILNKQISDFEDMVGNSWKLTDAPPEYIKKLQENIFGFKFTINQHFVTSKMSQNKSESNMKNILQLYATEDTRRKDLNYWHYFITTQTASYT